MTSEAVELAFSEVGAGPPLVILPGLFGSKRNWASIARSLGEHHRVITADLRNHGESPWAARHDYPSLAADVAGLIESVVGGPAAVLGHSMGGKAAMMLALTRPALVERLVVVDIAPVISTGTPIEYVQAMRALPVERFTRRSELADALAPAIPDRGVRNFLSLNAAATEVGLVWRVNLAALEHDFDQILGFPPIEPGRSYPGPALFLTGGRSPYVRPEHWPEIERLFPAAEFETIPAAGHWVHADAPEAFVAAVSRFLASA
ncbi:MAG: hypothetical protein RLZZ440_1975 [Planctomycetota bacterium]